MMVINLLCICIVKNIHSYFIERVTALDRNSVVKQAKSLLS